MHGFRKQLREAHLLKGTILSLASLEVAEILVQAGYDWLFIDAEHAPLSHTDIQRLILAAGNVPCLVRVAGREEAEIKKALDAGAAGVIVPQVNDAEQAAQAVACSRYPPLGHRGVGISRAQDYGFRLQEYVDRANDDIAVLVQAEHYRAVEQIEAIAQTPGLDGIFVGPYDLSASLGKTGQVEDAAVQQAIDRVGASARAAGKALGIFCATSAAAQPYIKAGYRLIAAGSDTLFLGRAARTALEELAGDACRETA